MLGLGDGWVAAAYWGSLGATLLCVIYGLAMRNKGQAEVADEDKKWAVEEDKVEEKL